MLWMSGMDHMDYVHQIWDVLGTTAELTVHGTQLEYQMEVRGCTGQDTSLEGALSVYWSCNSTKNLHGCISVAEKARQTEKISERMMLAYLLRMGMRPSMIDSFLYHQGRMHH